MAAYRRVYDSRHLQADCQEPGSAPDPTLGNRVKGKGIQFNDSIYQRKVSASRQLGVNNLPRVVTQPRPGRLSNSRPLDRKSDALPLRQHATQSVIAYKLPLPFYSHGRKLGKILGGPESEHLG